METTTTNAARDDEPVVDPPERRGSGVVSDGYADFLAFLDADDRGTEERRCPPSSSPFKVSFTLGAAKRPAAVAVARGRDPDHDEISVSTDYTDDSGYAGFLAFVRARPAAGGDDEEEGEEEKIGEEEESSFRDATRLGSTEEAPRPSTAAGEARAETADASEREEEEKVAASEEEAEPVAHGPVRGRAANGEKSESNALEGSKSEDDAAPAAMARGETEETASVRSDDDDPFGQFQDDSSLDSSLSSSASGGSSDWSDSSDHVKDMTPYVVVTLRGRSVVRGKISPKNQVSLEETTDEEHGAASRGKFDFEAGTAPPPELLLAPREPAMPVSTDGRPAEAAEAEATGFGETEGEGTEEEGLSTPLPPPFEEFAEMGDAETDFLSHLRSLLPPPPEGKGDDDGAIANPFA